MAKKASKHERRAALDRIVTAVLTETENGITVLDASNWLRYVLLRDETQDYANEAKADPAPGFDDSSVTPQEHLERLLECALDDPRDEIRDWYEQVEDIAADLDPKGYSTPIIEQADWLMGDLS